MPLSTMLKWITGAGEGILGIPIYGGLLVLSYGWTPLYAMLILHIVTLIFSLKENQNKYGSIIGIVTSCLAWIPILGMIMHITTAFSLLWDARNSKKQKALTK